MRIALGIGMGALLIAVAGLVAVHFHSVQTASIISQSASSTTAVQASSAPPGWQEYQNSDYHFLFAYPQDLAVQTYSEGGGAATITFQDTKTVQGFQIFIVPYSGTKISEQRFEEDEPSGVRQDPLNVTIDGVQATSFYGSDATLGATAEIWFIHGGYLYEVTTLKPLATWLASIMQTWKFI